MADLKAAVYFVVAEAGESGLRNADIGRMLGIYTGHEKHEGHISRTILGIMQNEGVVEQDTKTKIWRLKQYCEFSKELEFTE